MRRLLGRIFQWRVAPRWWAAVLVGPLLVTLAGMGVHIVLGGSPPDAISLAEYTLAALITAVYMVFFVALGEEVGWRGFLLPSLQSSFSALWASVIVGLVWAVWHLPLFFNPATLYSRLPFPLYLAFTIPFAILLTWVYNSTRGSLLLVIVFHAMLNGASQMWKALPDIERLGAASPFEANVLVNSLLTAVLALTAVIVIVLARPADLSREPRQTLESNERGMPRA
ncbi:MAG: CPBP family intramembrane glutamic endopeptidase [Chloroflexota bacterium]